jgi:hypothetical protein
MSDATILGIQKNQKNKTKKTRVRGLVCNYHCYGLLLLLGLVLGLGLGQKRFTDTV